MNILVHGYNVTDPQVTVGKLQTRLEDTYLFDYGWFGLLSVLMYNKREAKRLKELLDNNPDSTVYAHSNGCAIAVEAAKMGAKMKRLVCINPALKVDTDFPDSIKHVGVIFTKHDKPTKAARFFDKVPFIQLIVPNAWGAMGAEGPKSHRAAKFDFSGTLKGHSDFFLKKNLDKLFPLIQDWIKVTP